MKDNHEQGVEHDEPMASEEHMTESQHSDRQHPGEPDAAHADEGHPTDAELAAEREALSAQQNEAVRQLEILESRAAGVEDELAALADDGEQFDMLASVCDTLDALAERGAAELFWGSTAAAAGAGAQLDQARARVDAYRAQVAELVNRHRAALDDVEEQRASLDVLDYELYQAVQAEESRRQEWLLERAATMQPVRRIAMPWMRGFEDDRRFRQTLAGSLAAALLLGLLIPMIDLPLPEPNDIVEVPERFAKFLREEPKPPPPPPPVREELAEPEPEKPPPEPEEIVEPPPETELAVESKPKAASETKEKVTTKGILAFRENFSSLSENRPAAKLGSQARVSSAGESAVGLPERNMVAVQGTESSGGINLAAISRDVSGGNVELVAGVEVTRVESSIGGGGPSDRPHALGAAAGRTDEEIQIVFDRYKAALYRLYNRALRQDPTLRGQMVLKLTIESDGTVSLCRLESSDMKAPDLAQQVVSSVTGFDFGAKDVPPVTILYPIDFLPTA